MKKYYKIVLTIGVIAVICFLYAHIDKMHSIFNEDTDTDYYTTTEISSKEENTQKFVSDEKSLDGVAVKFSTAGENLDKVVLVYSIEDENGQVIREGKLSGDKFKNQKYNKLSFDRIDDAYEKEFVFKCYLENNDDENGVSFLHEGDNLIMKYYMSRFDMETFLVACALCLYVVIFMKILIKLFKE